MGKGKSRWGWADKQRTGVAEGLPLPLEVTGLGAQSLNPAILRRPPFPPPQLHFTSSPDYHPLLDLPQWVLTGLCSTGSPFVSLPL
jgi:hypothetical protein